MRVRDVADRLKLRSLGRHFGGWMRRRASVAAGGVAVLLGSVFAVAVSTLLYFYVMSDPTRAAFAVQVEPAQAWLTPAGWIALVAGAAVTTLLVGAWCIWSMAARLRALPRLDERVARLADSVTLLAETTEGCFLAVGAQLPPVGVIAPGAGRGRQRRVVSGVRRGQALSRIAAQEEISESEVGLRLHLAGGRSPQP